MSNKKVQMAKLKRIATVYKGDKCNRCGLEVTTETLSAFVFHHTLPEAKEEKISSLIKKLISWKDLKKELDKCELLCANCHHIEHSAYKDFNNILNLE